MSKYSKNRDERKEWGEGDEKWRGALRREGVGKKRRRREKFPKGWMDGRGRL